MSLLHKTVINLIKAELKRHFGLSVHVNNQRCQMAQMV